MFALGNFSRTSYRALLGLGVVLAASLQPAMAALLAQEEFNYATGALSGQNGGSGWAGSWVAAANASVVDPLVDLSGNRALAISGNNNSAAYRSLATAYAGSEVFVSFEMQLASGALSNNDFVSLWFDNVTTGAHTNTPQLGIKADGSGSNDVFVRTRGSAGSFVADSNVTVGQTFTLVGRLSKSGSGNYDRFDLWFNPDAAAPGTADASFSGNSGLSSLQWLGFRSANLDAGDTVLIDRLRIGTTWADVSPVPEPASPLLAAGGLLLFMCLRRTRWMR
ncbi:MAG: hypothetical protein QM776_15005 [Rhodocyclaceae bacterium]